MIFKNDFKLSRLVHFVDVNEVILPDAILIRPAGSVIERQLCIHQNLVDIYCCSPLVNHDRFFVLRAFTNYDIAFPDNIDIEAVL